MCVGAGGLLTDGFAEGGLGGSEVTVLEGSDAAVERSFGPGLIRE
jgi:hypothetical protein